MTSHAIQFTPDVLASIIAVASDAIFVNDAEGYYEYVNDAACRMLLRTPEELHEMHVTDVAAPEHADEVHAHLRDLNDGHISRRDWTLRRGDGTTFTAEVYARRLRDGRFLAVARDVTARRRTADESAQRVRELECIATVHALTADDELGESELLRDAAQALRSALRFPDETSVTLSCGDLRAATQPAGGEATHRRSFEVEGCRLDLALTRGDDTRADYSDNEMRLAELIGSIVARTVAHRRERDEWNRRRDIFESMVERSAESFCLIDPQTHAILEFNDAACAALGYTREEFAGLTIDDIQYEMVSAEVAARMREIVERAEPFRFATRHRHRDGSPRDVIVSNAVIQAGGRRLLAAVWLDVTEERRQRREIEARDHILRRAEELAHVGSWSLDPASGALTWSDETYRIFGVPPGVPIDEQGFMGLVHPEDRQIVAAAHVELREKGMASERYRVLVNGEVRWVEDRAETVLNDDGRIVRVDGATHDITDHVERIRLANDQRDALEARVGERTRELQQAVARLERNEQRVTAILEFEHQASHLAWRELLGLASRTVAALTGARYAIVEAPASPDGTGGTLRVASDDGHAAACDRTDRSCCEHVEHARLTSDGDLTLTITVGRSDIPWTPAERSWLALIADDVRRTVRRRRAELELDRSRARAEHANLAKSRFLANMSHEIRTPLNTILGLTHIIAQRPLDDVQSANLGRIGAAGQHLLDVINDILDVSRIEAGRMELHRRDIDLEALIGDVSALIGPRADHAGLRWIVDVGADVAGRYDTDPLRLRQVLINLAGNAVKFTECGAVRLRVGMVGGSAETPLVEFRIDDTGRGIAEDRIEGLFRPFEQGDPSSTRREGGTGLGLTIARRLTEMLGGTIEVESALGVGSSFRVRVPMQRTAPYDPPEVPDLRDGAVVLVEPDAWSREVIAARLTELGARVLAASDTAQAEKALDLLSVERIEPVCVMMGHAQTDDVRPLRQRLPGRLVPFIGLAWTDHPLASTGEWDAEFSPPFASHRLASMLRAALGGRSTGAHAAADDDPAAQLRARHAASRVLVVDDDPDGRSITLELLDSVGIHGVAVQDGEDAVLRVRDEHFDLVLMDLHMPRLDGVDATRAIRSMSGREELPIVALTASAFAEDRERCLAAGMNAHLAKPVAPRDLFSTLLKHLPRRRTDQGTATARPPAPTPSAVDAATCLGVIEELADLAARSDTRATGLCRQHADILRTTLGAEVAPLLRACSEYDFVAAEASARVLVARYGSSAS